MSSSTTFFLYFLLLFFPFLSFFFLLSSHFSPRFVVYFFPQSSFRHRLRRLSARERERDADFSPRINARERNERRATFLLPFGKDRLLAAISRTRNPWSTIDDPPPLFSRMCETLETAVQSLVLERRIPTTDFAVESRFAVDSADRAQTCRRRIFFFLFFPTERCCVRVVRVALAYVYVNG